MKSRLLKNFSVYDLVLIAMVSALTIAFKTVVGVIVRSITGPLGIPGGALAGGFYMLWLPLGIALVGKRGTAFFIAFVQTLVLLVTSAPGSHGIWTFITYLMPAVLCELVCMIRFKKGLNIFHFIFATILANLAGTIGSNYLFFRLSFIPLMFTLAASAFSGAIGGLLGYAIFKKTKDSGLLDIKTAGNQSIYTFGKTSVKISEAADGALSEEKNEINDGNVGKIDSEIKLESVNVINNDVTLKHIFEKMQETEIYEEK